MCVVSNTFAQSRKITGKVTGADDGLPLPGVSVVAKGANSGTQTDQNGNFSLTVPSNTTTLVVTYVGYANQEVSISGTDNVSVSLKADPQALNEVVVVGYGVTTKGAFTGTAKTVSATQIERKRVSNISQALAGEVAGVRVVNTSGQPGTEATIRIRGFGSVTGNRSPLYVLDGVPFQGSVNSINPADIETTTVLKDAAATAIYGSRGANGVILITTKTGKGKTGFIDVDVNFGTNAQILPRYDVIKSPEQYAGLSWESLYNQYSGLTTKPAGGAENYANLRLFGPTAGGFPSNRNIWNATGAALIDPVSRTVRAGVTRKFDPENWEDYAFQNSARTEANVRFGGGADKTSFFTSLGYLNDKGYSINSDYKRLSGRLNLTHQVKSWLTGTVNVGYAYSKQNVGGQSSDSGSIFWFVDNIPPIYPLFTRDAAGNKIPDPIFGGDQYDYGIGRGFGALTNSIADTKYNTNRNDRHEINSNFSLNAKIMNGLTFENTFGMQYWNRANIQRSNKFYGDAASQKGSIFISRQNVTALNLLNLLRYKKDFGDNSFEILGAHESNKFIQGYLTASRYNLVENDSENLNNGIISNPSNSYSEGYRLESYFSQVNYDYKKKYFLSGSIRTDGSSRFVNNKWGTFGSIGAGWLVSAEDFMRTQNVFSSLKLKASYGLIGDQAGVGYYPGYDLYSIDNVGDQPGFSFVSKGNPDLTWETSKMFQTGVEFTLGKYLTGSIDYYIKNTTDLIFDQRQPISFGYATVRVNGGSLRNQGLEFDFTGHLLKGRDYHIDLGVNGEIFKSKLTSMPIDLGTGLPKIIDPQGTFAWSTGHSIYDFYTRVSQGVDPADGKPMWEQNWIDVNGNGKNDGGFYGTSASGENIASLEATLGTNPELASRVLSQSTKTYANATVKYTGQSAIPDVRGAFNLTGGYKGFDLSVQMLYSLGGYAYDGAYAGLMSSGTIGNNNWHTDILNRWQKAGDITDVPRLSNNQDVSSNGASTRFITKASYAALNNVRLTYTFPAKYYNKLGLSGLSIWVSGDNLYFTSARAGFNPSTSESGSTSVYNYSPLSTISAGLRVRL